MGRKKVNRRQAKKRRCTRGELKGIKDLEIPDALNPPISREALQSIFRKHALIRNWLLMVQLDSIASVQSVIRDTK
jgi:hypothetical protein